MNGESTQTPPSPDAEPNIDPDQESTDWKKSGEDGLDPPKDGLDPVVTSSTTMSVNSDNKYTVQVITKYMCRYCARQFDTPAEMQAHISTHARGKSTTHSCYVCGKTYSTPSKLQRHVRVHSGERPYACNICGRRFTRSDHVKQHMKVHMPQKQRNTCRICGMKFLRRQTLHAHLQQDHGIVQVYTCHRCGEAFDAIEKLHTHKDSHLSIYPQSNVEEVAGGIVIKKEPGLEETDENPIVGLAKFSLGPQPTVVEEGQHTLSIARKAGTKGIKVEPNGFMSLNTNEEKAMEEMIKNALADARQIEAMEGDSYNNEDAGTTVTDGTQMFILPSDLKNIKQEKVDDDEEAGTGGNSMFDAEDHNKGCQTMSNDEDESADEEEGSKVTNAKKLKTENVESEPILRSHKPEVKKGTIQEIRVEPNAPVISMGKERNPVPKMKIKLLGPASVKAAVQNRMKIKALTTSSESTEIPKSPAPAILSTSTGGSSLARLITAAKPIWGPDTQFKTSEAQVTTVTTNSTVVSPSTSSSSFQPKKLTRCEHCCIWFEDYTMSLLHNSLHSADDTDPFTCRKCLKKLGNRLEFTAHLVWHLEPNMEG